MNDPKIFLLVFFICACLGAVLAYWKIIILRRSDEVLKKELKRNNNKIRQISDKIRKVNRKGV